MSTLDQAIEEIRRCREADARYCQENIRVDYDSENARVYVSRRTADDELNISDSIHVTDQRYTWYEAELLAAKINMAINCSGIREALKASDVLGKDLLEVIAPYLTVPLEV